MSQRLVTAAEMAKLDRQATTRFSIPSIVLMENAARSACEVVEAYFQDPDSECPGLADLKTVIVCGKGNNGGDGLAIARLLANRDAEVEVVLLGRMRELKGDARTNCNILRRTGVPIHEVFTERRLNRCFSNCPDPDVIIDAVFGTGFRGKPAGVYASAIDCINATDAFVLAIDIPSGVSADDGRVQGCAVVANATITMALLKRGLALYPGHDHCGDVWIGDIGTPAAQLRKGGNTFLLEKGDVAGYLPTRPSSGHKGTFGTVLTVAGSRGYTGAARLTSLSALSIGCGLSKLCVPISVLASVESRLVEVVKFGVFDTPEGTLSLSALPQIAEQLKAADVLAIGPGIGTLPETRELELQLLAQARVPIVIDADGINNLAGNTRLLKRLKKPFVLTPHPGEMSRLVGIPPAEVNADRIELSRRTARDLGGIIVLKGAPTVVAAPNGEVYVNSTGSNGLGKGGTGDVLTGMIAGLIAQGVSPFRAAQAGVFLHGLAGDLAVADKTEYSLLAGDLLKFLPRAIKSLRCDKHYRSE